MSTNDELSKQIVAFLSDYSIEATPHDSGKLDALKEVLAPGTWVYVAHPPGVPLQDIVELAGRVQKLGFTAIPHIISRKLESREQLDQALAQLQQLGINQALCVGGDIAVPNNAFDGSLEVLETGLFSKYGFRKIGVAGHPEGSQAIGETRVEQALLGKAKFASTSDLEIYIATQFGFDPGAVTDWEVATTKAGVQMPIHVGLAGPASLKQLVRFAMLCGIGSSARMLMARPGAMANLLKTQTPDDMITHLARHQASNPSSRLAKAHFFAFGGVAKTARWANAVVAGRFVLNSQGTGFKVEDVN